MIERKVKGFRVDRSGLPQDYPTHEHNAGFWEELGRAVAAFGFLEFTFSRAIFAYSATKEYSRNEIDKAFQNWLPQLEKMLKDSLGNQINLYEKAVRAYHKAPFDGFDLMITNFRKAVKYRNVICHGFWGAPNENGEVIPVFINRNMEYFDTPIDQSFLKKIRIEAVDCTHDLVDSVTSIGLQFPGSNGPGIPIYKN